MMGTGDWRRLDPDLRGPRWKAPVGFSFSYTLSLHGFGQKPHSGSRSTGERVTFEAGEPNGQRLFTTVKPNASAAGDLEDCLIALGECIRRKVLMQSGIAISDELQRREYPSWQHSTVGWARTLGFMSGMVASGEYSATACATVNKGVSNLFLERSDPNLDTPEFGRPCQVKYPVCSSGGGSRQNSTQQQVLGLSARCRGAEERGRFRLTGPKPGRPHQDRKGKLPCPTRTI